MTGLFYSTKILLKTKQKGPFAQKPQKWVSYLWTCPESRTAIKNENEFFLWWVDKNNNIIRQSCSRRLLKELICQKDSKKRKTLNYMKHYIKVWILLFDITYLMEKGANWQIWK